MSTHLFVFADRWNHCADLVYRGVGAHPPVYIREPGVEISWSSQNIGDDARLFAIKLPQILTRQSGRAHDQGIACLVATAARVSAYK